MGIMAVVENIPLGHKVALRDLPAGHKLLKYGRLTAAEALRHNEFVLTKLYRSA